MKKLIYLLVITVLCLSCKAKNSDAGVVESTDSIVVKNIEPDDRGYIVSVGQAAPDFAITLTDNSQVRLSQQKGKVIMLQFTASWCSVCRKEMPFIESDIWKKHQNNDQFVLWGIDRDEPLETVLEFAKSTGITYPLGLDPNADIFGLYADKKAGITRNVIIDKEGKIVLLTRLYNEEEFAEMVKKIDELLQAE